MFAGYVIMRTVFGRREFVARPGQEFSYTPDVLKARVFTCKTVAEHERCVDNEVVVSVVSLLQGLERATP